MNKAEFLLQYNIHPVRYQKKNKVDIITTKDNKYVLKKGNYYKIYEYLLTRDFNNLPHLISESDSEYTLYPYIEDYDLPEEQRVEDFIYLLSILHTKTTFYKTVDLDKIKEIFENLRERQDYLIQYYHNLQDMIETETYMSPSHYQLIRNLSLIYFHLTESKMQIEKWYDTMKDKRKMRYVMTHGNLKREHFIENGNLYFISFDSARINSPVYDLENFYRNNWRDTTLDSFLEIYQSKYELNRDEFHLLMSLIHMPERIEFGENELENMNIVHNLICYHERLENWKLKAPNQRRS